MSNPGGAKNALTKVTTREDPNGFCRTTIQTEKDKVHSLDVLTPEGELFCRLNITIPANGEWGNVDVIWNMKNTPEEEKKVATVIAWYEGTPVLRKVLDKSSLVAVSIDNQNLKKRESK